jgi:hypothetical protein
MLAIHAGMTLLLKQLYNQEGLNPFKQSPTILSPGTLTSSPVGGQK